MNPIFAGIFSLFTVLSTQGLVANHHHHHHQPPCNHESIEEALERDKAEH